MSVKLPPPLVETLHCTVGAGAPLAAAVNVAVPPAITQRIVLPSPGRSTSGVAQSINRSTSASHRIAGQVNGAGVYWTNF